MKNILLTMVGLTGFIVCNPSFSAEGDVVSISDDPSPNIETGIQIYNKRCVLCHGKNGMGQGFIPLTIKDYPSTNLMQGDTGTDINAIREAVVWGGTRGSKNSYSPPWGKELSWTEVESVSMLIKQMREQKGTAQLITTAAVAQNDEVPPSMLEKGRRVYKSRCVLCHGEWGKGDGKMSKIIKDPPPFNLTLSGLPDEFLKQIIMQGGKAVGRSYQMPPWKDELSEEEIDSTIYYIKTLRAY